MLEEPGESAHLCSFVIGIEHANNYTLIQFVIRFERKFLIRRSLILRDPLIRGDEKL